MAGILVGPLGRHAARGDDWIPRRLVAGHERQPRTDAAKVRERMRRPNFGTLEIEVTVEDSKAYTKI